LIYTRNPLLALQLKIVNPRKPVVWEVNGLNSVEFQVEGAKHPVKAWLAKMFEEKFLPMFLDKIIAVVLPIKDIMVKSGADAKKIDVVRNGADHVKFNPDTSGADIRKKYNIADETKVILFTGTIRPWHGMQHILNIFSNVTKINKDVKLLVVGTAKKELLEYYEQLVDDLGLKDNIIFVGWVDNEKIPDYIAACDVGIHTAIYPHDLNPFKVLEYMAAGKPVIGSIYGLQELIGNSNGGNLVNPLKYEESAEKIIELFNDKKRMNEMGKNARSYVMEHHDWRKNMKKLHDILNAMLQEKKSM
jgi:glycosyltransferase involved in cell wall biosynthesis